MLMAISCKIAFRLYINFMMRFNYDSHLYDACSGHRITGKLKVKRKNVSSDIFTKIFISILNSTAITFFLSYLFYFFFSHKQYER